MTKKEFDIIKEVINERIKLDDIGPAVRLVTLYNRHELINNRVMGRLYNCIRNGIYITCSLYDELKEMYIKLLELYEKGLNSWIDTFEKDPYKTKKEKHRLNVHKIILVELKKLIVND